jgi:hypothetical protein
MEEGWVVVWLWGLGEELNKALAPNGALPTSL